MYYIKMTFTPQSEAEITEENVEDESYNLWGYLGDLRCNGQIYKDFTIIYNDKTFQAFFLTPELDSIDEKNCRSYTNEKLAKIKNEYTITTEILGKNIVTEKFCTCAESSWYILYTCQSYAVSPIVCGDCLYMIPAYKFSHVQLPKACQPTLGWQADYDLIDQLWRYSSFDRFTYRQMSNPESQLSKSGREICAAYEHALNKPFYYFLYHFSDSKKSREQCPICKSDWALEENIGNMAFKCDKCRIISC
ncbi:MAG: Zn-ribbon-containing protein [Defluviitaleaceae bacterium]|nr:Zn-ribbon-containing protein [Defluviitaleaceae bacterium]